ncbi:MAG: hypothetical protein K1Y02_20275 [Candidatus Hydrogenedentes bacterium]|nr:hypothetical protein [Candidatus Hydrogenedentota bacterium]
MTMDVRVSLIRMLQQLHSDMLVIQQQGAGYYSCTPFARRYNKLLEQARKLFTSTHGLIETFEDIAENDPKDPADKMKVVQAIRVEIGQLLTLLESTGEVTS